MLQTLIGKEIRNNLLSLRFALAYLLVTVLLVGSAGIMLGQYATQKKAYDVSLSAYRARAQESRLDYFTAWEQLYIDRPPVLTQFLALGGAKDADPHAMASVSNPALFVGRPRRSPVVNLFPSVDMVFIVGVVLSLVVFMLSYDTISGERESGTMRVLFASPVPRHTAIFGKAIGGYISLILPFLTSWVIIALLLVLRRDLTVTDEQWIRMFCGVGVCLLYLAVVFSLAVLASTVNATSARAILVLLVCWVVLMIAVPSASPFLAHAMAEPPLNNETEMAMFARLSGRWHVRDHNVFVATCKQFGLNPDEQDHRRMPHGFWDAAFVKYRAIWREMADSTEREAEAIMRDEMQVAGLSRWLARVSPFGCLQNAMVALAQTDLESEHAVRRQALEFGWRVLKARGGKGQEDFLPIEMPPPRRVRLIDSLTRCGMDVAVLVVMGVLLVMASYLGFVRRELL